MNNRLNETLRSVEVTLDSICRKEAVLSDQIRGFANQADELIEEVAHLRHIIADFPVEALQPAPLEPAIAPEAIEQSRVIELPAVEDEPPGAEDMPTVFEQAASPVSQLIEVDASTSTNESLPFEPESKGDFYKALGQFELDLGIKWLSRIGIVALLIGIAMALSYSFPSFPKEMKILTGFIVATGLFFGGGRLHPSSPILGRILQGGGLSVGYLSLFAAFFIPEVQLFDSAGLGLSLLFLFVGMVLVLAHRLNSQTVALLSLAFGYYTSAYAESHLIAFISTAILSLGTVGVTRLHQDWRILPKANLLGALLTYGIWYNRDHLYDDTSAKVYLAYTFALFHIVSVLRGVKGDLVLNLLNSFGFYLIYSTTQPAFGPPGTLEFIITGVQMGSLVLCNSLSPEYEEGPLATGLVVLSLLFGGLGTMKHFDNTDIRPAILAAEALCVGLLSTRKAYRPVLIGGSYILYFLACSTLINIWPHSPDQTVLLNAVWITLIAFVLEYYPFRKQENTIRAMFLGLVGLLYLAVLMDTVPQEFRTISFVLSGFACLATGFFVRRKVYRWLGLAWIFIVGGISIFGDMTRLETIYKILLFILLGVGLLGGSYGYSLMEKHLAKEES